MVISFLYAVLRSMNLRARYLRLMKRSGILVSASRARMDVVLIEPSTERKQVFCIVSRSCKWACEAEL